MKSIVHAGKCSLFDLNQDEGVVRTCLTCTCICDGGRIVALLYAPDTRILCICSNRCHQSMENRRHLGISQYLPKTKLSHILKAFQSSCTLARVVYLIWTRCCLWTKLWANDIRISSWVNIRGHRNLPCCSERCMSVYMTSQLHIATLFHRMYYMYIPNVYVGIDFVTNKVNV